MPRLFVAFWPDDVTRHHLYQFSREVGSGNLVPKANLHLTIKFIGAVGAEQLPVINAALAKITPPRLRLDLNHVGYWPRSRLLWLGPDGPVPQLSEFAQHVDNALQVLEIEAERRPFTPHVTLARSAKPPRKTGLNKTVHWPLNQFVLVESKTLPEGAVYNVVTRFPAV